ncbi:fluoride efflux transporter CrcB [Psychrobacter sanguinis]|jgi:fluoride exporter|uniref:fluoride efflux transporter CrcB n=1 Tax=Psychrobacter sanguinis TaxID=861445 RepID=UPI001919B44E|nr:fluoride efflux transporter CrcB [Psychrobacter sanguinis]MCC3308638.1 fluoride efflux transporter CrcB [Psychrobacter sanguinis]UEC25926.1 fluoride efflux transporter CrcB [Psychrobacter sanguinis]
MQWLAIGIGAGIGACLRAWLAKLNPLHSWIPLGTLSANVLGGLLIGIAMVIFMKVGQSWHPNVKLFVITGFLGGLTTFSTFSSEVFGLLNEGKIVAGLSLIGVHVLFTLVATAVGYYLTRLVL